MTYKIIEPIPITSSELTYSSVAEDDYDAWDASAVTASEYRIYDHKIYLCMVDSANNVPPDNIYDDSVDPATGYWKFVSATNRYKCFDSKTRSKTIDSDIIKIIITPGTFYNSIAVMDCVADALTVVMTSPVDGEVFRRDVDLNDYSEKTNWYSFFWSPILRKSVLVVTDLPAYPDAYITIIASNYDDNVELGEIVVGRLRGLGVLLYGYTCGIKDWSKPNLENDIVSLEKGQYRRTGSFEMRIDKTKIYVVKRRLESVLQIPVVFVGDEEAEETVIYGFYDDFTVTADGFSKAICNLSITELS